MRKIALTIVAVLSIGILFTGCKSEFKPKAVKRVIIIGFDGMSVGGLLEANTPSFDNYMANGAYSLHCRNILPTVSSPNWAAMLTGSNAAQTGVTSNGWEVNNYKLPPVLITENGRYPDIFYILKKNKPALKTASVYDWGGFGRLYDKQFVDIDIHPKGAVETAKSAVQTIINEKPDFLFIHFDHVDHAGHADGHMTAPYLKSIELADSLAALVMNACKEAGTFDETLFIITADHGGIGHGHGDMTVQGNEVPFLMYGAGVKKGYELPVQVNLMDLASTVAYTLDVPAPQAWIGRPVICAFDGAPNPDSNTLVGSFLSRFNNTPVIHPTNGVGGRSGGLFIGEKALVTIKSKGVNGKIRYTTDGSIPTKNSKEYTSSFTLDKSGVIKAAYFGNDGSFTTFAEGYFRMVESVTENTGIAYTIYQGKNLHQIPSVAFLKKLKTGKAFEISTEQIADQMCENIAVVFEGVIHIKKDGKYKFHLISDDGSKLYINNKELINNDGDHGTKEESSSVDLIAGKHAIKVEYFNGGGGYFLVAGIEGPGIPKQIISPEYLTIE